MSPEALIALNYGKAMAGLDLVVDGHLRKDQADMYQPLIYRFIDRLLEQLEDMGRPATAGEHTFLLRAIHNLYKGQFEQALADGWNATEMGDTPLFGGIETPDFSVSLREALERGRDSSPA